MKNLSLLFLTLLCTLGIMACGGNDDVSSDGGSSAKGLSCSISEINAPVEGGEYTILVNSERGEWDAYFDSPANTAWVTLKKENTASKQGTIIVTIPVNSLINELTGTITVKSGVNRVSIPVKQQAAMNIQPNKFYSKWGGETFTAEISASGAWTATTDADWITLKQDGKQLTITTAENKTYKERDAVISVACGKENGAITVHQASQITVECPIDGYHLVWNDEFEEGDVPSAKNWKHEVKGSGWVNHELQNYVNGATPNGVRVTEVKEGKLRINCLKENGKVYSGRIYGNVSTGWKYCYAEAKIKLPSGKGTWPAFWMMPVNFKSWPHDGEIDIMEEVGYHKDYVSSSLHADGHVHSNGTQVTKEVYCKGAEGEFHVYGMEWTPSYFQFYVDGKKTLYYANPGTGVRDWPYDAPFYVILNLAWGGDWGGSQGVNEAALPVTMEVDYVRIFQKN